MASETVLNKGRHEETAAMDLSKQVKRSSLQNEFARLPKEKVLVPIGSMNTKFQDKATALKTGKLSRQAGLSQHAAKRSPVQSIPLSSKPWPGRKAASLDELVKHMSNVPSYLQRTERGDNLQGKALNFGVLEWGLLERWTNHQNRVANISDRASSSSSNESSSFSTFEPSTRSSASIGSSIPSQRKQLPSKDGHNHSSVTGERTHLMGIYPDNSKQSAGAKRILLPNSVAGHDMHLHPAHAIGAVDMRSPNGHVPRGLFSSTSKCDDASAFAHKLVAAKDGRIKREQKLQHGSNNIYTDRELRESNSCGLSDNGECIWDHLQQSFQDGCISSESPVTDDGKEIEIDCSRFSVDFPGDIQLADQSPRVPHSCPLPRTSLAEKPDIDSIVLSEDIVTNTEEKDKNRRRGLVIANPADRSNPGDGNSRIIAGRKSTNYFSGAGLNWMSRSSSLKEGSFASQSEPIACANKCDKETSKDKGRRSPLRRLLDPLLRPKNHTYFSGPIGSSSAQQSCESTNIGKPLRMEKLASLNQPHKLVDKSIDSPCGAKKSLNASFQVASEGCFQDEKPAPSTRQALLQLAWKNELPLFMLSCGDCDILAATMRKKKISEKDNLECVYTIFTVQDSKKKNGAWIKPGNKNKKQNLVSNTVGEMRVSCSKSRCYSSKKCHHRRQFVLVGCELMPTSQEPGSSQFNSELAAIVCNIPRGMPETSNGVALCRDSAQTNSSAKNCSCHQPKDLQTAWNNENSSLCSVSVILPSGIHGLSTSGEPTPLIKRWESGGVCDCGGWDEGCMLTILTDNFQECMSSGLAEVCSDTDGTRRFELFSQGRSREDGHAFSMLPFKEGLYTIEFRASITLLQAFVICIARLHNRHPTRQAEGQGFRQHPFSDHERKNPARRQNGVPTSYVPNHPPLSPVGRA